MKIPILIKSFKRAELTLKVLDRVMEAKPEIIYITSDGPRLNVDNEKEKIFETRKLIDNYDFGSCNVTKKYLDKNLGINKIRELTKWFFEHNKTGILLEDDIIPNISYFNLVEELLERYENNEKVKFITGSNFISKKHKVKNKSYFFTNIPSFWGCASWAEVWNSIDFDLANKISEEKYISILKNKFTRKRDYNYFKRLYDYQRTGSQIGGDQKIMFNIWAQNGVCIAPSKNLISNIGIDHKYANSKISNKMTKLSNLKTEEITNINHPSEIIIEKKYDQLQMDNVYNPQQSIITRGYNKIKRTLKTKIYNPKKA